MSNVEQNDRDEVDTNDVTALNRALDEEKEKAENYLANWQRAQADFTNYKRRSEQEKEELSRFTKAQVMTGLLSVLDDMERALESIEPRMAESSWVEGIRLIERKLRTSLETQGLSLIQALGETFDPNFHEAAGHSKGEEGIVVLELQKGYMLYDRVLRPSMVIVGNGETEE